MKGMFRMEPRTGIRLMNPTTTGKNPLWMRGHRHGDGRTEGELGRGAAVSFMIIVVYLGPPHVKLVGHISDADPNDQSEAITHSLNTVS